MGNFLGNPKNVFWEAFLLTAIVFVFGLFLGYALEGSRAEEINRYYVESELLLLDALALNTLSNTGNVSCAVLAETNLAFADRIYEEARLLDTYDEANKLSDTLQLVHQRYDLLRTLLWISAQQTQESCSEDFALVVYLYERETNDLAKKATQNVWSKVLAELKQEKGSRVLLIPISVDDRLSSLQAMVHRYKIGSFPAVVVNGQVVYELSSVTELENYL